MSLYLVHQNYSMIAHLNPSFSKPFGTNTCNNIYNTQFLVQFIYNLYTIQIQFKYNSYIIHIQNTIRIQFIYKTQFMYNSYTNIYNILIYNLYVYAQFIYNLYRIHNLYTIHIYSFEIAH